MQRMFGNTIISPKFVTIKLIRCCFSMNYINYQYTQKVESFQWKVDRQR